MHLNNKPYPWYKYKYTDVEIYICVKKIFNYFS